MVAEVLQYIVDDIKVPSIEADCLYAGIMIDTRNFMNRTGVRTFEAAAYLRRCGADITRVRKMFRDDMESYRAKAEAMRMAEATENSMPLQSVQVTLPVRRYWRHRQQMSCWISMVSRHLLC